MALRALTPGKAAFCSECGTEALPEAETCSNCHEPFQGYMDAVLCPLCAAVNQLNAAECSRCAAKLPTVAKTEQGQAPPKSAEEAFLRRILRLSRERAKARAGQPAASEVPAQEPRPLTEDVAAGGLEEALWKLSAPFSQLLDARRKRLEQIEVLIERARAWIQKLEGTTDPIEVRERDELKRQIEELLLEKEDILRLEEGLVELERTYRNVLHMQEEELTAREASMRSRLDAFRHELENRERVFGQLRERETDIARREDEFRRLINRLHEREKELDQREELLREKARLLDERHHALSEAEVDLERRRWEVQQKVGAPATPGVTRVAPTIMVQPSDRDIGELRSHISELEEQLEKLSEDMNGLRQERAALTTFADDVKGVMKELDELLGELPEEKIRSFARSGKFAAYERILDRLKE